jgi:hypothetical protein
MSGENGRPSPPIYTWIITFLVFGICLLCWFPKFREFTLINQDSGRLGKFRQVPESDTVTKMVIIGSSVTARGVLCDEALEQMAKAKGYGSYKVVMFAQQSASLYDFGFLFDRVLDANPDIIIIQSSLVFYGNSKRAYLKLFYEDYTNSVRRAISAMAGRMRWDSVVSIDNHALDLQILQTYLKGEMTSQMDEWIPREMTADDLNRKIAEREYWVLYGVPFSWGFGSFLKLANQRGIGVYFLNIPVSEEFDQYLPGTSDLLNEEIREYRQKFGVRYIDRESAMPREDFSDFVHMTLTNKLKYTDWFLRQLQIIRSQPTTE